ncbi:MAG: hypothetical protein E6446_03090 [Gemella haemolysans]|nr:hypothetical protein [Gemella haemolysans]
MIKQMNVERALRESYEYKASLAAAEGLYADNEAKALVLCQIRLI